MKWRNLFLIAVLCFSACDAEEAVDPVVTTNDPQQIGQTSVVIEGSIKDAGSTRPIQYGFLWSASAGINIYNAGNKIDLGSTDSKKTYSIKLETLTANTTYYVKAYTASTNYAKVFYGNEISFKTLP